MRVLVTGGNGFLGATLAERLLERTDHAVVVLIRPGSDDHRLLPLEAKYGERLSRFEGTLSNPADCGSMVADIDILYHVAAGVGGPAVELFTNSSIATRNLLDAVVELKTRPLVVFCSSFGVYQTADLARDALIDENTPLETKPHLRDLYSYSKLHQEQLVLRYRQEHDIPVVTLRPGVIYGAGSATPISGRVGLDLFGLFLRIGDDADLPLTHVRNCADALIDAGKADLDGRTFNVVDDDLITTRAFFKQYRRQVRRRFFLPVPYALMHLLSRLVKWYSTWSGGQLPAVFTPYKTASQWRHRRYSNAELKSVGWNPEISMADGLKEHFAYFRDAGSRSG